MSSDNSDITIITFIHVLINRNNRVDEEKIRITYL